MLLTVEPLFVLRQSPKQKSELRRCVAILYFCFIIFLYEIYEEFLVHLIAELI